MHGWQVRSTIVKGFRKAGFPTDCFENSKMLDNELLKDIEKMLRLAKTDETSAMKFANGDKDVGTTELLSSSNWEAEVLANFIDEACEEMDVDAADENHSITTEKIISHKQFAAYLEKMKSFAVQK
ncbi:hypothetical protein T10_12336 [Trichinella papuae]|uniref:Uncharacterized protein n=1 Tax=Trichinella papuae TaxID=268474 RepID=A0A0V1N1X9_9BILA|nr:hypothetical protein T10_12336 [Trichinella papuae]